jgi:hypothetical protein
MNAVRLLLILAIACIAANAQRSIERELDEISSEFDRPIRQRNRPPRRRPTPVGAPVRESPIVSTGGDAPNSRANLTPSNGGLALIIGLTVGVFLLGMVLFAVLYACFRHHNKTNSNEGYYESLDGKRVVPFSRVQFGILITTLVLTILATVAAVVASYMIIFAAPQTGVVVGATRSASNIESLSKSLLTNYRKKVNHFNGYKNPKPDGIKADIPYTAKMEKEAQHWANSCPSSHSPKKIGENMYFSGAVLSTEDALKIAHQKWFEEYQWLDHRSGVCQSGKKCGHYVQMAWQTLGEFGCAVRSNCNGKIGGMPYKTVVICNYMSYVVTGKSSGLFHPPYTFPGSSPRNYPPAPTNVVPKNPSVQPTQKPTQKPTVKPTVKPTQKPSSGAVKAPTGLRVRARIADVVRLAWDAPAGNEFFKIYRNNKMIARMKAKSNQYYDTSAQPKQTYKYHVAAVKGGKDSAKSNGVSVQTRFFQARAVSDIIRLYFVALNRMPTKAERDKVKEFFVWFFFFLLTFSLPTQDALPLRRNQITHLQIAKKLTSTSQFRNKFGKMSDSDFVKKIFLHVHKRSHPKEAQFVSSWVNKFKNGVHRAEYVMTQALSKKCKKRTMGKVISVIGK